MNTTPNSNRKRIVIVGAANVGKSTLFNRILNQPAALVSPFSGTTTDCVTKAMELADIGAVLVVDTPGLGDDTPLSKQRDKIAQNQAAIADLILAVINDGEFCRPDIIKDKDHIIIDIGNYKKTTINGECVQLGEDMEPLLKIVRQKLSQQKNDPPLLGNSLPEGSNIIAVVPIDQGAPKGRLILPQAQLIRECLDYGIRCLVVQPEQLAGALNDFSPVSLVVTDSQAYRQILPIVPKEIKITTFSVLFAGQKGDIEVFEEGVKLIEKLPNGANILISECCTHNKSHVDIGMVKIPAVLAKFNKNFKIEYTQGNDFPEQLEKYQLVIHCGGCMVSRQAMLQRINKCKEAGVPITNYGLVLMGGHSCDTATT